MREKYKVLIVDDEMLIRQGIINYINWGREGFEIIGEASTGEEALIMIEKLRPHIVMTDIVMPVMNGIELVRIVKRDYPDMEIIVLSSFEDYDFVRSTFQSGVADYVLKPNLNGEELLQTLHQLTEKIPNLHPGKEINKVTSIDEVIMKLLSGYESGYDEKTVADNFPENQFCYLAIYCKKTEHTLLQWDDTINSLKKDVKDVIFHPILIEETSLKLLLNFDSSQLPIIKHKVIAISKSENASNMDLKWILSDPFESIHEMKNNYEEKLLKIEQYLFYLPDLPILIYDDLPKVEDKHKSFNLNYFIEVFKKERFKVAFHYLEHHVQSLSNQYNRDIFEFKSFLGNIIFNIIVLMGNLKYYTEDLEANKYNYFANINDATDAHEVVAQFKEFLNEVNNSIYSKVKDKEHFNVKRLLDYIDEHYTEALSLTEIANYFHFNPSYLSTYFSTHHNQGFSEYLNQVRLKKSMDLLKNSRVSISDISGMVGYSDHSYFCRVFKKAIGKSPSSYRREVSR